MKKSKMNAKVLRGILTLGIFVIIGLSAVGFYFAQAWLSNLSLEISDKVAQSDTVGDDIQSLKKLQEELAKRQDIIVKSSMLLTSTSNYQGQVIKDLDKYASMSGLKITSKSFEKPTASASTKKATTPQSSVVLSVESPLPYSGLLSFLNLVESNLPKMQVSSLNIGRVGDSKSIRVEKITIGVYTN